jgi:hypothetical protein
MIHLRTPVGQRFVFSRQTRRRKLWVDNLTMFIALRPSQGPARRRAEKLFARAGVRCASDHGSFGQPGGARAFPPGQIPRAFQFGISSQLQFCSSNFENTKRLKNPFVVAQTSKSAVSRISKSADFARCPRAAGLEVGDPAGLETCATRVFRVSTRESYCCRWRFSREPRFRRKRPLPLLPNPAHSGIPIPWIGAEVTHGSDAVWRDREDGASEARRKARRHSFSPIFMPNNDAKNNKKNRQKVLTGGGRKC